MSARAILATALGAAAILGGACTCAPTDYRVSSPDVDATHRHFPQSETSMVRIDLPPDRPEGEPASRFVVGYNDGTDAMADAGANCWLYPKPASLDGWANSSTFGGPWDRQTQLPVSPPLLRQGVNARHGDPWLAAWSSKTPGVNGIILYASVAQQGLARVGPPWFLLLSRSRDHGLSFEDGVVALGPQPGLPDGPKVAIAGDGAIAVLAWTEVSVDRWQYRLVWGLDQPTMHVSGTFTFDPRANADPPDPSCTSVTQFRHPHLAAGQHTFYLAGEFTYFCSGGTQTRIEVHRNPSIGLALGVPWQRILSAVAPPSQASVPRGLLNAQNIVTPPRFGTEADRGDILPSLAVGQDEEGEYVVAVTEQVQAGTAADEAHRERLVQWRIPGADHCDASSHRQDLGSCGLAVPAQEIESISTPGSMRTVASRVGLWASKPAVFTGKVPDGTIDRRVGLVWYAQPYKGRLGVTDEMRTRTIVEGAISTDGGKSYSGPFNLTAATEGDGIFEEPDIGPYFYPCSNLCLHYYGEYVSGAFQFADPGLIAIVGAWGDSREGCLSQSVETQHMHVWAGTLRGRLQ